MDLSQYNIGEYLPEHGYVHRCARGGCPNRYTGRANKKFCSQSCKSKVATDIRSGNESRTREIEIILRSNLKALDIAYLQSRGTHYIPVEYLKHLDFNWRVFSGYVRGEETGNFYHLVHDMAYSLNDGRTQVLIQKKNEIH